MAKLKVSVELGQLIRDLREFNGLTLRNLAEKTDITDGYISRIERGCVDVSIPILRVILMELNVNPAHHREILFGNIQDYIILKNGSIQLRNGNLLKPYAYLNGDLTREEKNIVKLWRDLNPNNGSLKELLSLIADRIGHSGGISSNGNFTD